MGKKRRILFAILLLAILGALAWTLLRSSEPEPAYQGKTLSEWLKNYDALQTTNWTSQQFNDTRMAIEVMGTNTIPVMLQMLRTPDPPWKTRLFALAKKQHVIKIKHVEPRMLYLRSMYGFLALGPRAAGAVPELVKIYDQNPAAQSWITFVFAGIGPNAKAAVPSLLRGAVGTNDLLRNDSLSALGRIHQQPDLVVPVLINALQDRFPLNRTVALASLGDFGTNARAAVPAIMKLIDSKDSALTNNLISIGSPNINEAASQALRRINSESPPQSTFFWFSK